MIATSGDETVADLLRLLDGHRRVVTTRLSGPARWRGPVLDGADPIAHAKLFDSLMEAAPDDPLGLDRLVELWRAVGCDEPSGGEIRLMARALARADEREAPLNAVGIHLDIASISPGAVERRAARLAAGYLLARAGWWSTLFTAVDQHFVDHADRYVLALERASSTGDAAGWELFALEAMVDRSAMATWYRERPFVARRRLRALRQRDPAAALRLEEQLRRLEEEEADGWGRDGGPPPVAIRPDLATVHVTSPESEPLASVIVPAWRAEDTIARCLRGLEAQDADFPYEVVVACSGDDSTALIARTFPRVRVVWSAERLPTGAARNAGIRAARGRYLCFLAADCVPRSDWLRRRVEAHGRGHALVGGFVGSWGKPTIAGWAHYLARFWALIPYEGGNATLGGPLFHLSYAREAIERVTAFPNAIAGEDTILNQRLVDLGYRVFFDPAIRSDHIDPRRSSQALIQQRAQGRAVGELVGAGELSERFAAGGARRSLRAARKAVVNVARHRPTALFKTVTGLPLLIALLEARRRAIAAGQGTPHGAEGTAGPSKPVELAPRRGVPRISAIVAAYNEERLIGRCIDSLLAQDAEGLEIVVVDDGSTDGTGAIAESRAVTVIRQAHAGPARARNIGATAANGKVVVFVDADLMLEPACLRILTEPVLEGRTVGTFTKDLWVANPDSRWASCWTLNRGFPPGHVFPPGFPDTWSNFRAVDRDSFLRAGGFDDVGYGEDLTLAPKLGCKAAAVPGAVMWHHNPDSIREVWENAVWIGRGKRVRELRNVWWRFSPPRSLARGVTLARRARKPSFLPFALVYDAGVLFGYAASHVVPARHWK